MNPTEHLRWMALAILNRLFPPERPTDEELIALGAQMERERQQRTREREQEQDDIAAQPTMRYSTPIRWLSLSPPRTPPFVAHLSEEQQRHKPEQEQQTDALSQAAIVERLQHAWWHNERGGFRDAVLPGDVALHDEDGPETEQHRAIWTEGSTHDNNF